MVNRIVVLKDLIAKELASLSRDFELFELEFDTHKNPKILRVYVDRVNRHGCKDQIFSSTADIDQQLDNVRITKDQILSSAAEVDQQLDNVRITVEDCSKISRHLGIFLRLVPDLNVSNYVLEVSSPGLERKLVTILHFAQNIGKEVKFKLFTPIDGMNNFVGKLCAVDNILYKVFIKVDGQDLSFDVANIAKANVVYRKL